MKNTLLILFSLTLFLCTEEKEVVIGIQTFGEFNKSLVDTVKNSIEQVYGVRVEILSNKALPEFAFVNVKSPRYRADSIIRLLKREKPDSINFVLGLIEKDISTTKRDKNGEIRLATKQNT